MKTKKNIFLIIIFVLLIAIAVNSFFIIRSIINYNNGNKTYDGIKEIAIKTDPENIEEPRIDFSELKKINPDIVGW